MGVIRDRENSKYSTPLQVRRITKVLEGRRCPDRESVVKKIQESKRRRATKEAL